MTDTPRLLLLKSLVPISFSNSLTARERLGCEINRLFAASFIDPVSAIAIIYLNCVNVMVLPFLIFSVRGLLYLIFAACLIIFERNALDILVCFVL